MNQAANIDAIRWCFLAVFVMVFGVVGFLDVVKTRALRWYMDQAQRAPQQSRPWYVRLHEFTQQR